LPSKKIIDEVEEKKDRPRSGGSRSGIKKVQASVKVGGSQYVVQRLLLRPSTHDDNFQRHYRMSKDLFIKILHGVREFDSYFLHGMREFDPYFSLKHDGVGTAGFSSIQKCTAAMRMLAYGEPADAQDGCFLMSESIVIGCMYKLCRAVVGKFGPYFLRGPSEADTARTCHGMR
jgi:hypothetical protein